VGGGHRHSALLGVAVLNVAVVSFLAHLALFRAGVLGVGCGCRRGIGPG
jgi:hypothetical protein